MTRRRSPGRKYHPGRTPDNAKAIASGELQVLVDYLRELALIPYLHRDPEACKNLLYDRVGAAPIYAEALAAHLFAKGKGAPREFFTLSDAVRAVEAAQEYKRLKGTRHLKGKLLIERLEKEIQNRYGISRAVLRAALKDELPPIEFPGIPSADI